MLSFANQLTARFCFDKFVYALSTYFVKDEETIVIAMEWFYLHACIKIIDCFE